MCHDAKLAAATCVCVVAAPLAIRFVTYNMVGTAGGAYGWQGMAGMAGGEACRTIYIPRLIGAVMVLLLLFTLHEFFQPAVDVLRRKHGNA